MHTDKHFIHTIGGRYNGVIFDLFEKIGMDLVVGLQNKVVVIKRELTTIEIKKKLFRSHKNHSY